MIAYNLPGSPEYTKTPKTMTLLNICSPEQFKEWSQSSQKYYLQSFTKEQENSSSCTPDIGDEPSVKIIPGTPKFNYLVTPFQPFYNQYNLVENRELLIQANRFELMYSLEKEIPNQAEFNQKYAEFPNFEEAPSIETYSSEINSEQSSQDCNEYDQMERENSQQSTEISLNYKEKSSQAADYYDALKCEQKQESLESDTIIQSESPQKEDRQQSFSGKFIILESQVNQSLISFDKLPIEIENNLQFFRNDLTFQNICLNLKKLRAILLIQRWWRKRVRDQILKHNMYRGENYEMCGVKCCNF